MSWWSDTLIRAERLGFRAFRWLPVPARRTLVRLAAPTYTVGATCVVRRADGAVLLVRQAYRAHWGVPGGLLARGETPAQAALREVREEVGLAVDLLGEAEVVFDPTARRIDVVYRSRPSAGDGAEARSVSPEIVEAGWYAPDALPPLQLETTMALRATGVLGPDGTGDGARE